MVNAGKHGGTATEHSAAKNLSLKYFAPFVGMLMKSIPAQYRDIVHINATSQRVSGGEIVNNEQFERQLEYSITLVLAKEMIKQGVIDHEDYLKIDELYMIRCRPIIKCPFNNSGQNR